MKRMVEVVRNADGWWEVRDPDGTVLSRFVSEFQAWTAGRSAAERLAADLTIHQDTGAPSYEKFDEATRSLKPIAPGEAATPSIKTGPDGRRRLILLVEDMLDARELYAEYLNYAGFSVVTAINGHEAVRLARMLRPDLILMDIRMPGMDGLEATADLKADPDVAHIPVVAITADRSADIMHRALAAGCAALISKPALPDEVAREISRVLGRL